jgi:hypothetical protein
MIIVEDMASAVTSTAPPPPAPPCAKGHIAVPAVGGSNGAGATTAQGSGPDMAVKASKDPPLYPFGILGAMLGIFVALVIMYLGNTASVDIPHYHNVKPKVNE